MIFKNEIITGCYFFSKGVIELQGSGGCWTKLTDIYNICDKYLQNWKICTTLNINDCNVCHKSGEIHSSILWDWRLKG